MTGVVVAAWELESGVAATAAVAAKRRTTSNVFRIYSVLPKNTKNSSSRKDEGGAERSPLTRWIPILGLLRAFLLGLPSITRILSPTTSVISCAPCLYFVSTWY